MKRCPQCSRVETDDALAFCRADGTALISDSGSFSGDAGTAKFGSGPVSTEIETSILPHTSTAPGTNRPTGPTTVLPATQTPGTTRDLSKPTRNVLALALVGLLLGVVAVAGYFYVSRNHKTAIESIAVMPFVNEGGDPELEYLSDGMTETLIRSLSQLPNVNVKARSSVFRYKGKATDAKTIGKELGVQAVLNGRVVQRGEQLSLNLELIDAQTENVIWSESYNRKQSDLISLQSEVARDVSSKLKLKLSGADAQKIEKTYTTNPEAYRLYLQGRFYWNKRAGKEFDKAENYFQQAVEKDPNFALGYVGLADTDEDRDRPRKKEYIRRALELDDQLAEAHASLGYQYMLDYNWAESERELKRAIALNPNYAQAHQWEGARLMMLGRYDESLASIKRALVIDPTSAGINFYYGVLLFVSGRTDDSIRQFKTLAEMEPTLPWSHRWLSRVYWRTGDYAASVEERAKSLELDGKPEDARLMRESFAKSGLNGYLKELVRQNFGQSGTLKAEVLTQLGEKEEVIATLVSHAEPGDFWLFLIKTDPHFDPLRDDPRFQELLKKFDQLQ
jgi:TolB-like protein/Tfp pilus assembly protein PilF